MPNESLTKALSTIAKGLFGNQGTARYERPRFTSRPLDVMLKDLVGIEMIDWRRYAFSREPLNGKFNDQQRESWMEHALACGKEYARKVCEEYSSDDPDIIARAIGINVSYPDYPDNTDRVTFAEYRATDMICIYMDAVKKAEKLLESPEVREVLTDGLNVSKLLLAHELFHYIEEKNKEVIYTKTEKTRLWSLGPIHNDSTIIALSEIAAMSFAKEITKLPYAPYVMDVFLVYGYSPEEASGLYEEMMMYTA